VSKLGELWRRVCVLLRGEKFSRELEEEMRLHREWKRQELRSSGANDEQAHYAASRAFGNSLALREWSQDVWGSRCLWDFAQDLRFGLRLLRKSPGFSAVAILILGLGIGANTTIFSLVNAVLLQALPFPNASQIVLIFGRTDKVPQTPMSYPDFEDFRKQSQSFDGISAWAGQSINLTGQEKPERVRGAFVSANFFSLLGVLPTQGRLFAVGEDEPGAAPVALVNYSLWTRRFGSDPNFVGKRLILNASTFTVIGILPPNFDFPLDRDRNEIWLPFHTNPYFSPLRDHHPVLGVAKLKDGVELSAAQAETTTIAKRLAQQYPDEDGQRGALLQPLQQVASEGVKPMLLVLLAAVALVLLIACVNVVNLLLARCAARRKEITLRAAMGASRTRLARQILTEALLLWMAAGVLGLLLGVGGLRLLVATSPVQLPPGNPVRISLPVLLFTFVLTGLTATLAGLAPAWRYSRGDFEQGLKIGGRAVGDSAEGGRLRGFLLIAQVGMSLMLLAGAGLMLHTLANLATVRPGFEFKNLLTLEYRLPKTQYSRPADQWNFHQRVVESLRRIPGVRSAAVSVGIPYSGNIDIGPIVLLDRGAPAPGQEPLAQSNLVGPGYFETMGMPIVEGRSIRDTDGIDSPRVVVINQMFAQQFWRSGDALGRQLELLDDKKPAVIVGIVGDVRQERLDERPQPQVYFAYRQDPNGFATLVVRTASDPMQYVPVVRDAVWSLDKEQPMWKIRSMEHLMQGEIGERRYLAYLLSLYAVLATFLAAVGIYGVLNYAVNLRTREIGVRIALGAQPTDTLRMIVGDGMRKVGLGIALGLACILILARSLSRFLYDVAPTDPAALAAGVAVLGLAGLLACWIPARRATRVDPMKTLRTE